MVTLYRSVMRQHGMALAGGSVGLEAGGKGEGKTAKVQWSSDIRELLLRCSCGRADSREGKKNMGKKRKSYYTLPRSVTLSALPLRKAHAFVGHAVQVRRANSRMAVHRQVTLERRV